MGRLGAEDGTWTEKKRARLVARRCGEVGG